jgi:hypothetical protein
MAAVAWPLGNVSSAEKTAVPTGPEGEWENSAFRSWLDTLVAPSSRITTSATRGRPLSAASATSPSAIRATCRGSPSCTSALVMSSRRPLSTETNPVSARSSRERPGPQR